MAQSITVTGALLEINILSPPLDILNLVEGNLVCSSKRGVFENIFDARQKAVARGHLYVREIQLESSAVGAHGTLRAHEHRHCGRGSNSISVRQHRDGAPSPGKMPNLDPVTWQCSCIILSIGCSQHQFSHFW